jgi:hypothetical protein
MSDRFSTSLEFGGPLPAALLPELSELLTEGYMDWNTAEEADAWSAQLEVWAAAGQPGEVTDPEGSYETFSAIREWCREHQLSYRWMQEGKYEYDGELEVWSPEMTDGPRAISCLQDGEAVVSVASLKDALDKGKALADLVNELSVYLLKVPALALTA